MRHRVRIASHCNTETHWGLTAGSSLHESVHLSSVAPATEWHGHIALTAGQPTTADAADQLQQVEAECVYAAKLALQASADAGLHLQTEMQGDTWRMDNDRVVRALQGIAAGVQGIIALQRALRLHGLSAYASILKAFLQAGPQHAQGLLLVVGQLRLVCCRGG